MKDTITVRGCTITRTDAFILIQAVDTLKEATKLTDDFYAAHPDFDEKDPQFITDRADIQSESHELWGYSRGMCFALAITSGQEGLAQLADKLALRDEYKKDFEAIKRFYYNA